MARTMIKVSEPLHRVLCYVGRARGGLSPRRVGQDVLAQEIRRHPVGAQMIALVGDMRRRREEEQADE